MRSLVHLLLPCWLALSAAVTLAAAHAPTAKQGVLGWGDSQFWSQDSTLEEKALAPFEDSEVSGLFLDGPKRAGLRQRGGIPLVAIRAGSLRENAAVGAQQRAILVSTRLEGDETAADLAFRRPDKPQRPRADRAPASPPEGRAVKLYRLGLAERIEAVAELPGTWTTTLLLYDQRSNSVVTRVEGKASAKPHATEPAAAKTATKPHEAAYRARPDSPEPPAAGGIVLASVVDAGKGRQLRGSFVLPALPRDVAAAKAAKSAEGTPVAILPVTLVLTGDADAAPVLVPLHVPVYEPLEKGKGELLARGYFTVDLAAAAGEALVPQSYAVWALSRAQMSRPLIVRIEKP